MSAQDYPVTFGYGAQDGEYYGPNGSVGKFHRGNDRPTSVGTPVIIGNTTIGKTGVSGVTGGPHLHDQAGTDKACQNTFDPTPLEFMGGTVVATGIGTQWGKYVTLQVGDKYITYCHLSEINVQVGQKVEETIMAGVTVIGAPAAVTLQDGSLHVFARGSDNRLWQKYFNQDGWHKWVSPVQGTSVMSSPTASVAKDGSLHVYATGPAGDLMHWWFNSKWNGAESLGFPQ